MPSPKQVVAAVVALLEARSVAKKKTGDPARTISFVFNCISRQRNIAESRDAGLVNLPTSLSSRSTVL